MTNTGHSVLLLSLLLSVGSSSPVEDCIRDSSGVEYRGTQQKSSTGKICANWNITTRDYDIQNHADSDTGVGDHNFCRNPDGSDGPWCYVPGTDGLLQREACAIDSCQDESSTEAVTPAAPDPSPVPTSVKKEAFEQSLPAQAEGAAVQPVMGVSQRVRTGPKKKKDLGTLGYVLAILMMGIIILLGVGITVGYFYKRGRDLKKQHEQRVYEREMHRITLPLSAFANPTCELVDENTIVITAEPTEQTPTQDTVEGGDPLINPAGTPGA